MKEKHIKLSKYLSLILRHKPDIISISLDECGWANISDILRGDLNFTFGIILDIVSTDGKNRYELNNDRTMIRARQGHSIEVELNLKPIVPPVMLYHGSSSRFVDSILCDGIKSMNRNFVHLSDNLDTASTVGIRHGGDLVVFKVDSARMVESGFLYFLSTNNVYLTKFIPVEYITLL